MKRHFKGHYPIGNDLTYLRVIAYLSEAEVARSFRSQRTGRLGVTPTYISELEQADRVLPEAMVRYAEAVSKALRAMTRWDPRGKSPHRTLDLDEVLEQWPRFFDSPPPRGKELAKLVRLTTPREVWAWSRYHGADELDPEQLDLLNELAVWPDGHQPEKPQGPKQIVYGQGDTPQPRPTPSRAPSPPPKRRRSEPVSAEARLQEALEDRQRAMQRAEEDEVQVFDIRWQG